MSYANHSSVLTHAPNKKVQDGEGTLHPLFDSHWPLVK